MSKTAVCESYKKLGLSQKQAKQHLSKWINEFCDNQDAEWVKKDPGYFWMRDMIGEDKPEQFHMAIHPKTNKVAFLIYYARCKTDPSKRDIYFTLYKDTKSRLPYNKGFMIAQLIHRGVYKVKESNFYYVYENSRNVKSEFSFIGFNPNDSYIEYKKEKQTAIKEFNELLEEPDEPDDPEKVK